MGNTINHATIRIRLQRRRAELEQRTAHVRRDLRHQAIPLSADAPDRAVEVANDRVLEDIGAAAADELRSIDDALRRLDDGHYGQCRVCQCAIPEERLAAIPHATLCFDCAMAEPVISS